jgi:hypothetical protein
LKAKPVDLFLLDENTPLWKLLWTSLSRRSESEIIFVVEHLDNHIDLREVIRSSPSDSGSLVFGNPERVEWFGRKFGFDSLEPLLPLLNYSWFKWLTDNKFPLFFGLYIDTSQYNNIATFTKQVRFPYLVQASVELFHGYVEAVHSYVKIFFDLSHFLSTNGSTLADHSSLSELVGSYVFRQDQLARFWKDRNNKKNEGNDLNEGKE